jgi:hypothetical protein
VHQRLEAEGVRAIQILQLHAANSRDFVRLAASAVIPGGARPGARIPVRMRRPCAWGGLSADEMDWNKTNFFESELELGHCLRTASARPV